MIDAYRTAAAVTTDQQKPWTFAELIRCGDYYADPLYADRWTGPVYPIDTRVGPLVPEQSQDACGRDKKGEKFFILRRGMTSSSLAEVFVDAAMCGLRVATLRELLWLGIHHADWIRAHQCSRLYAAGSFAWQRWEIDGRWTVGIPYLSDCPGRVRLQKVDKLPGPDEPQDGFVKFLTFYRDA